MMASAPIFTAESTFCINKKEYADCTGFSLDAVSYTHLSLKTVPQSYREGALGLGAGKWHMIRTVVPVSYTHLDDIGQDDPHQRVHADKLPDAVIEVA